MLENDPNRIQLVNVAKALTGMDVVFIGGATVGLLITDADAPSIRATKDVDVIVEVVSLVSYQNQLRSQLLAKGFAECTDEGAPMCRWVLDGALVDVVPTDPTILGFAESRWFERAIATAQQYDIDETTLQVITAVCFLATKFDAFSDRGDGDHLASHDIEDIVAVIDGRPELVVELSDADDELSAYVIEELSKLTLSDTFAELVHGNTSATRVGALEDRIMALANG